MGHDSLLSILIGISCVVSVRGWITASSSSSAADRQISTTITALSAEPHHVGAHAEPQGAPFYPRPRDIDDTFDLTGGRPGAIIESEEQLATKETVFEEIDDGTRSYPQWFEEYGELLETEQAEYDVDDPEAIDSSTLGTWTIQDLNSKFDYEWDPLKGEMDPNILEVQGSRLLPQNEMNDDGVEVGYDPIFGPSNPIDTRTVLGTKDSYMIDDQTRDDTMLTPQFQPDDPEIEFNQDVVRFRKSLDLMETYVDDFLPGLAVPRHVAKWYGYPEQVFFEPKNYTNNRFTPEGQGTDFSKLDPHRARVKAVELARAKNADWLPDGVSQAWHTQQRQPYEDMGTLVGTFRQGECDPEIVEQIQPALKVLGSCVDLLSIHLDDQDESVAVYRFLYHGLMKNKHGMNAWTQTLLKECGVPVSGVVFETGFRKRDSWHDGGDPWHGPST